MENSGYYRIDCSTERSPIESFSSVNVPLSLQISVPKQQIVDQVLSNPSDVLTRLQPEIARDANGNPTGLTAKNIDSLPIAKTLGLQNGDVLQSVNGEMIDSVSKIAEIAGKYGNAANLNITVLRNGKPISMTYNLE